MPLVAVDSGTSGTAMPKLSLGEADPASCTARGPGTGCRWGWPVSRTPRGATGAVDSGEAAGSGAAVDNPAAFVNRSHSQGKQARGAAAIGGQKAKSNPELAKSFDGLNFRQQRLANGGNQFSVEPPDQGLCAGNGYVMEAVNDVTRVYDPSGNALTGVEDLNTFFGYAPAIVRSTRTFGPFVTDPSCYFDSSVQRWYLTVLTLEVVPTGTDAGQFTGANHLDVA